jgi:hypothetical protein
VLSFEAEHAKRLGLVCFGRVLRDDFLMLGCFDIRQIEWVDDELLAQW